MLSRFGRGGAGLNNPLLSLCFRRFACISVGARSGWWWWSPYCFEPLRRLFWTRRGGVMLGRGGNGKYSSMCLPLLLFHAEIDLRG